MGLFGYTIAGGGFILIGAWESLTSSSSTQQSDSDPSSPLNHHFPNNPPPKHTPTTTIPHPPNQPHNLLLSSPSLFTFTFSGLLSLLFIANSVTSTFSAWGSQDKVGSPLQLQVIPVASMFLVYSILGLVSKVPTFVPFPAGILNSVALFGFVEEFLLFYLQRKDQAGVENRYYDLMLLPVSICVVSTVLELKSGQRWSLYPRIGRGVGLIMQGMWFIQMGISFYSSWMVKGCDLIDKSRGNFSIKCKGHMEYHRGRGIATLLFNCHLALIVVVLVGVYSLVADKNEHPREFMKYKPLGEEMSHSIETAGNFTLDSDEDEEIGVVEENAAAKGKGGDVEMSANGYGSHQ